MKTVTKNVVALGRHQRSKTGGFSLLELLLALILGIGLNGAILQLLISESNIGLRVNRLLRERSVQQRTLALIREEVQRSSHISSNPQLEQHACSLGGRLPVLQLTTPEGLITYSVGTAPSSIWRGQVLMRCGPSFNIEGKPALGATSQNRVMVDGLASKAEVWQDCSTLLGSGISAAGASQDLAGSARQPFSACLDASGSVLAIRLLQDFPGADGRLQRLKRETVISSMV